MPAMPLEAILTTSCMGDDTRAPRLRQVMKIEYHPIGVIHSPFTELEGMPIQPAGAPGIQGTVELFPEYREGLQDLEGFSHLILLYHFHRSQGFDLRVIPFLDRQPRGLFATRAPKRPNPIGLSVVKLLGIQGGTLHIENIDIVDGTPLLDIKPYIPEFDGPAAVRTGWLEATGNTVAQRKSDTRFIS
jgi:tRNA-Thr(GGU) m(6)t(6)A37 methyltransferase TsaA